MHSNEPELRFSCSKCGACCSSAPHLSAQEILGLSESFFIQMAHYVFISPDKSPIDRALEEHYSKFCHTFVLPEKKCKLFYFVCPKAISAPSQKCPQLTNQLCSIEHKKPVFCKLSPLNPIVPEQLQGLAFAQQWLPRIKAGEFLCKTDTKEAKIIFLKNEIFNNIDQDMYYDFLLEIKNLTDDYIQRVIIGEAQLRSHVLNCYNGAKDSLANIFYTSPVELFSAYFRYDLIDESVFLHFIENQVMFIQKQISKALSDKNTADRANTALMRKELERLEQFQIQDMEEQNDLF